MTEKPVNIENLIKLNNALADIHAKIGRVVELVDGHHLDLDSSAEINDLIDIARDIAAYASHLAVNSSWIELEIFRTIRNYADLAKDYFYSFMINASINDEYNDLRRFYGYVEKDIKSANVPDFVEIDLRSENDGQH